jgi:hypothetical protein
MLPYYARMSQSLSAVRMPPEETCLRPRRRRPHEPKTLDRMRELYETTHLSTRAIAAATAASAATVSRRARRGGWLRPDTGFPIEHYSPAGRRKLRRGAIAERLLRQAEHLLFLDEMNPSARRRQLAQSLRLVRAARALDAEERPKPGRKRRKHLARAAGEVESAKPTG